jgi:hypothetical protein
MRGPIAGSLMLAALLALPAEAQQVRQQAVIGPFGGVNFAKFGGSDVGDVNTRTGFQAGIFGSFPVGKYIAIVPSVSYAQEGTSVDVGGGVTGTLALDYIEVPLLLKLGAPLAGTGQLRPYVTAGPALGFLIKCKVKASNASQSAEADCDDPTVGADAKSVQFSADFGAGLDIGRFTVGLRYQLGLTSVDDTGADADVKNRVFTIIAGYGFRLGH